MELNREGLARLLVNVDETIVTLDETGTITWCSPSMREYFGWAPHQLIGHNFSEFAHPDELAPMIDAFDAVKGHRVHFADGASAWRLLTSEGSYLETGISVASGEELGGLGGIAMTIRVRDPGSHLRSTITKLVDNEGRLVRLAATLLESGIGEFQVALQSAVAELSQLTLVGRASLWFVEEEHAFLQAVVVRDVHLVREFPPSVSLQKIDNVAGGAVTRLRKALAGGHPELIPGTWLTTVEDRIIPGTDTVLAAPLIAAGRFRGFLLMENTWGVGQFDATHFSAIASAAAIIAGALQRKEMETELSLRANTDPLTGLANRWSVAELIGGWLEASVDTTGIGIALLDLDRFRIVNESFGHVAGDRLLVSVAERLSTALEGTGGVLGRLGGDEFIAAWRSPGDAEATRQLTERLTSALKPPFVLEGSTVPLTASTGVVHVPRRSCGANESVRRAEEAMYRAKNKGGNLVEVDDESRRPQQVARMQTETELRAAISQGLLETWYQGEWDLSSRTITGAEALARWRHPRRGLLGASEFVALAEEMGVIESLGYQMLSSAMTAMSAWSRELGGRRFEMRVNVSARQLHDASLVGILDDLLSALRLDPTHLCLELTESTLLGDPEAAAATLAKIRDLGVGLAIDDFGTGYSSLVYLKRLPITCLKIDQVFVQGLPEDPIDTAVVAAVVELAERLDVTITAEGLETEAQRAALLALGCDRAQGFLLSMPEPPESFAQRL